MVAPGMHATLNTTDVEGVIQEVWRPALAEVQVRLLITIPVAGELLLWVARSMVTPVP